MPLISEDMNDMANGKLFSGHMILYFMMFRLDLNVMACHFVYQDDNAREIC